MFFRMSFTIRWRSMRTDVYRELHREFLRMLAVLPAALPHNEVPLADLQHIVTRTYGDRLESVRKGWALTQQIPVTLYEAHEGAFELADGNHRLTMARCTGSRWVRAVVLDYEAGYEAACAREEIIRREIIGDQGAI